MVGVKARHNAGQSTAFYKLTLQPQTDMVDLSDIGTKMPKLHHKTELRLSALEGLAAPAVSLL